jgi:serine protease AprX
MTLSGRSEAAPMAAGAAAVPLQASPGLGTPLVKAIPQYSAQVLPGAALVDHGAGLVNLEGAGRLAQTLRTDLDAAALSDSLSNPAKNGESQDVGD